MQDKITPKTSLLQALTGKRWRLVTLILLLLGVTVLVLLPYAIREGISRVLVSGDASQVKIEDIDFNPFTGDFRLTKLKAHRDDRHLLVIDQAHVHVAWLALFRKQVLINEIELHDSTVHIEMLDEGRIRYAGILPGPPTAAPEPGAETVEWGLGADRVSIRNTRILLSSPKLKLDVKIERADLTPLHSWAADTSGKLELLGSVNGTPVELRFSATPFGDIAVYQGRVIAKGLDINVAHPFVNDTLSELQGALHLDTAINLSMSETGSMEIIQQGDIRLESTKLGMNGIQNQTDSLAWSGRSDILVLSDAPGASVQIDGALKTNGMELALQDPGLAVSTAEIEWTGTLNYSGDSENPELQAGGALTGTTMSAHRIDTGHRLLGIQQLDIKDIEVASQSDIKLGALTLDEIELSRKPDTDSSVLVALKSVSAIPLAWHAENGLTLGDVVLTDLQGHVARNTKGTFPLLDALQLTAAGKEETAQPVDSAAEQNATPIRIGSITAGGKSLIRFRDETVSPAFDTTFNLNTLKLVSLDSTQPEKPSVLTLDGKTDRYSKINFNGDVYPFKSKPTLKLKGELRSVALPALSAYSSNLLGYVVNSGSLDGDIDLNLDMGEIKGENKLTLRNLTLRPAETGKTKNLDQQLNIPLDSALSMLRDKNNNIRLDLPISGNIDDPSFNLNSVINIALGKAMRAASTSYLSYALQPYGAILGAVNIAGKVVNAVQLEPLTYAPGSAELATEAGTYLEKISGILTDRPKMGLRLCGIAAEPDRGALLEKKFQAEQEKKRGLFSRKVKIEDIAPVSQDDMEQLARQRGEQLKDTLVETYTIAPERLYLCHPEVDTAAEGKPRVDLSI